MKIVILGLSITSSCGNGHATTYRGLVRELHNKGHDILFLERDVSLYATNRDLPDPDFCRLRLYNSLQELKEKYCESVRTADLVIVGSYVSKGVEVGEWVLATADGITAFYDIDTPVTLAKLVRKDYEYLAPYQIRQYDLYLSFAGGKALEILEMKYDSPMARPLYCSFDPDLYYPQPGEKNWMLGYLGNYSEDRQPPLEDLMLSVAWELKHKSFVVAGPAYPDSIQWPENTERIEYLPPDRYRSFYNAQRFTLNITHKDMVTLGYSPSVRLFEAAACGTPVISDHWEGLDEFFEPEQEILISQSKVQTLDYLRVITPGVAKEIGERARQRVLENHTAAHRAEELQEYVGELINKKEAISA